MSDWDWRFKAKMLNVVDGDTYDVDVALGLDNRRTERIRLLGSTEGVNTDELHDPDPDKRVRAQLARARVLALAPPGTELVIRTEKYSRDGFRRYLAQVILPDGRDLGDLLMAEGLAKRWVKP